MTVTVSNSAAASNPDIVVEMGSGNVTSDTQRVVIASDQPAIDVNATLDPSGLATLSEQEAQTALLTTIDADTSTLAGAVVAGKVQVEGSVSVDPTGLATESEQEAQTALLTTIDADTGSIATNAATIAGAVSGTEMQVDVLTMPTTTVQATNLDIRDLSSATDSVAASQSGTWNINNISGTVSLPSGASTAANQTTGNSHLANIESSTNSLTTIDVNVADLLNVYDVMPDYGDPAPTRGVIVGGRDSSNNFQQLSTDTSGRANVNIATALPAGTNNIGDVDVLSMPTSGTATLSNVSGSASSVTLLSSNISRKGATIWNNSTAILYVKFGSTASATSCTVKMVADAYYEVPFGYTGIITGIWASATGNARVTELS